MDVCRDLRRGCRVRPRARLCVLWSQGDAARDRQKRGVAKSVGIVSFAGLLIVVEPDRHGLGGCGGFGGRGDCRVPGMSGLDVVGPLGVFAMANRFCASPAYVTSVVSMTGWLLPPRPG